MMTSSGRTRYTILKTPRFKKIKKTGYNHPFSLHNMIKKNICKKV